MAVRIPVKEIFLGDVGTHPFAENNRNGPAGQLHCRHQRGDVARVLAVNDMDILCPEELCEPPDKSRMDVSGDRQRERGDVETAAPLLQGGCRGGSRARGRDRGRAASAISPAPAFPGRPRKGRSRSAGCGGQMSWRARVKTVRHSPPAREGKRECRQRVSACVRISGSTSARRACHSRGRSGADARSSVPDPRASPAHWASQPDMRPMAKSTGNMSTGNFIAW